MCPFFVCHFDKHLKKFNELLFHFLANGFQKKTQKTPKKEIEMALKIKAECENEK
jgi:phage-related protein